MAWWFDEDPGRLVFEKGALTRAEFTYSVKDDGKESGLLTLDIEYRDWEHPDEPGKVYHLTAVFPREYPAFPFAISVAKDSPFPPGPHLNPQGSLCLLQNPGANWVGSRDYLAAFLLRQVKDILRAHRGDGTVLEAQEGLRQTHFIVYQPGSAMLVGDWDVSPEINRGYFRWRRFPTDPPQRLVRGAVTRLETEGNVLIGELNMGQAWNSSLQRGPELVGRWVRLPAIPKGADLLEEARAAWPAISATRGDLDLVGLLIPEEKERGRGQIDNWVFILRATLRVPLIHAGGIPGIVQTLNIVPIRAEQYSNETKWARGPRAVQIGTKTALLVGLGAVGAPLAWQLARAGIGTLWCVDDDIVQIGNIPRWLYGMGALGDSKAECVAWNLMTQYPPLHVESVQHRVGVPPAFPDNERYRLFLAAYNEHYSRFLAACSDADIIVDATAEPSVNRYLASVAKENDIPYVWAYGTPGGWGGIIGRIVPWHTRGCYECFRYEMAEATTALANGQALPKTAIIPPPEERLPDVQPVGCFHPTFRGTGFDMDQVSQMAARLIVGTLCLDAQPGLDSYPDFPWDVAVLSQWDPKTDLPTVPTWTTYRLDRHPDCQRHDD